MEMFIYQSYAYSKISGISTLTSMIWQIKIDFVFFKKRDLILLNFINGKFEICLNRKKIELL